MTHSLTELDTDCPMSMPASSRVTLATKIKK